MAEKVDPIYYLRRTPTVTLQKIASEVRRGGRVATSMASSSVRYAMARIAERAEKVVVREPIVGVDAVVEDVGDVMVEFDASARVEGIGDTKIALSAGVKVEEHVEEGA